MRLPPLIVTALALASLCAPARLAAQGTDLDLYSPPKTPQEFFRAVRFELSEGQLEQAAKRLDGFLKSGPDETDYLAIMGEKGAAPGTPRTGLTPFLSLRNVDKWSSDPKVNADAKKNVDTVIDKARTALANYLGDEGRLRRLILRLSSDRPEVSGYAVRELKRAERQAAPVMLEVIGEEGSGGRGVRGAVLQLLPELSAQAAVPPTLAYLDTPNVGLKTDLINSISARDDAGTLLTLAETDPRPTLWYYAGLPDGDAGDVRAAARRVLQRVYGQDLSRKEPAVELTRLAREFYDRTGGRADVAFSDPTRVNLWRYEAGKLLRPPHQVKVPQPPFITAADAEAYYALRYGRWATERATDARSAQVLFLSAAAHSAYMRTSLDVPFAQAAPAAYRLLATAPEPALRGVLAGALRAERTPAALAAVQVIGDRRVGGRALLAAALDYKPDYRVRFAAADALLRLTPADYAGLKSRILEVLSRSLPDAAGVRSVPTAMIADPDPARSRALRDFLAREGFAVRSAQSGRDLVGQLARDGEVAVVFLDHHLVAPQLPDVMATLRADRRFASLPVMLTASPDAPRPPPAEYLLRRLAVQVAATDGVEPVSEPDLIARQAEDVTDARRGRLLRLIEAQAIPIDDALRREVAFLAALVTANDLPSTPSLRSRLRQLAKEAAGEYRFRGVAGRQYAGRRLGLVAGIDEELPPEAAARRDQVGRRVAVGEYVSAEGPAADPRAAARLSVVSKRYPRTYVIPPVYSRIGLTQALSTALGDGESPPVGPAARVRYARRALYWIEKMASGELTGFPLTPLARRLIAQLAPPDAESRKSAARVLGHFPGSAAQEALAKFVVNATIPADQRAVAAAALVRSVQENGSRLSARTRDQIAGLPPAPDAELQRQISLLTGAVAAKTTRTLELQQQYRVPLPRAPEPKEKK